MFLLFVLCFVPVLPAYHAGREVEQGFGVNAEVKNHCNNYSQARILIYRKVFGNDHFSSVAVCGFLNHVERINRAEDDAQAGQHHNADVRSAVVAGKKTVEQHKLAHKTVGKRQGNVGQRNDDQCDSHTWRHRCHTAHLRHVAGAPAVFYHAYYEPHAGDVDAVVEHLHHDAMQAYRISAEGGGAHKAHVGDRRVSDEALNVRLHNGDAGCVNNAYYGEYNNNVRPVSDTQWHYRQQPAQHGIQAHLHHQRAEDDGNGRRRLLVSVGLPGVEGEYRHLDGEGNENEPEDEVLCHRWQRIAGGNNIGPGIAHSARRLQRQVYKTCQQHEATYECVDKEFERNRNALFAAPAGAKEVNGNKRELPEHVEHERICSKEHSHEACLRQQHKAIERAGGFGILIKIGEENDEGDNAGKQAKHAAHTIGHQRELGAQHGYPLAGKHDGLLVVGSAYIGRKPKGNHGTDKRQCLSAITLYRERQHAGQQRNQYEEQKYHMPYSIFRPRKADCIKLFYPKKADGEQYHNAHYHNEDVGAHLAGLQHAQAVAAPAHGFAYSIH